MGSKMKKVKRALFGLFCIFMAGSAVADEFLKTPPVCPPLSSDGGIVFKTAGDVGAGTTVCTNETQVTEEIKALARSLQNDPLKIYEFVRNTIDYRPTRGIHTGADGCLTAGYGNDWDQSALLSSLLRTAGYTTRFVQAPVAYYKSDLSAWLGADTGKMISLLNYGGIIAGEITGVPQQMYIYRVWVEAQISGNWYTFDPAFKEYESFNPTNPASAMGYSRSDFLSSVSVGATVSADYVQDINSTNLVQKLMSYTTNLTAYIRQYSPNARVEEVLGGRRIIATAVTNLSTTLPKAYFVYTSYKESWDHIALSDNFTLHIMHQGLDISLKGYEAAGKRLSIFYDQTNGYRPKLYLDGAVIATGNTTVAGSTSTVTVLTDHPYSTAGFADRSNSLSVVSGGKYVLVHEAGNASAEQVRRVSEQLRKDIESGLSTNSEAVLGGGLHLVASSYMQQNRLVSDWLARQSRVSGYTHHWVGLAAQTEGFFVDLPGGLVNDVALTTNSVDADTYWLARFFMSSALEHGVFEQNQRRSSVSTVRLLYLNNQNGSRTYLANSTNWNTVKSALTGYSTTQKNSLEASINQGYQLILPANGSISLEQWTGFGHFRYDPVWGDSAYLISGGYNGGHSASDGTLDAPKEESGGWWSRFLTWLGIGPTTSVEPVDLFTGDYLLEKTDLALGSGTVPQGSQFTRFYNSGWSSADSGLGYGWRHDLNIRAQEFSDPESALGARTPYDAVAQAAANVIITDLMSGNPDVRNWLVCSMIAQWQMSQLTANAVRVETGNSEAAFIRQPDGTYAAAPNVRAELEKRSGSFVLKERFGTEYRFRSDGWIDRITDAGSNAQVFVYNAQTNLQTVTDAFGRTLTLAYTNNRISTVSDSTGRQVSFEYSTNGNLTAVTDPENKTWTYQYDTNHQITAVIDPESITTIQNRYDLLGCVTQQLSAASNVWNFYIGGGQGTEEDPYGQKNVHWFDKNGRNLGTCNALGYRAYNMYDGQGHLITRIDARGVTNIFVYDADHDLLSNTEASGTPVTRTTSYGYDSLHRLTSVTNALGNVTRYQYDAKHRLVAASNAAYRAGYTYYDNGLLHEKTDGRSQTATCFYDTYGNVQRIQYSGESVVSNLWSARGDLLKTWNGSTNKTEYTYDANRQLLSAIDPRSNTAVRTYYANGLLKTGSDAGGRTNRYSYTPAYKPFVTVEPDGDTVSNFYDQADRLVTVVTPEERTTHYGLNAIGQSANVQYPATAIGCTFDANGNITDRRNAKNEVTHYDYDVLNRLTNVTHQSVWKASFAYDAVGNVISRRGAEGAEGSFAYDPMNRLTNSVLQVSGFTSQVSSSYDLNGNRTNIVYPGGLSVGYSYDSENRLSGVLVSAPSAPPRSFSFSYDGASCLTNLVYPNGVTGSFVHNPNGQIIEYRYQTGASNFLRRVMERNALGFKTVEDIYAGPVPAFTNEVHETRAHNAADQLISTSALSTNSTYSYDPNGCLTNLQSAAGNQQFTYDFDNRLTQVSSFQLQVSYLYDASGSRIGRIANGATNYFVLDYRAPLKMPLAETDAQGNITRYYIWSTQGLLAHIDVVAGVVDPGSIRYYHADEQGSTLALTDESGNVTDQYTYAPYGEVLLHSGTNSTPYQWLGALAVRNEGNRLYYMFNRYYSADMKRFISVDPKGIEGGYNLYAYGNLNPLFYADPFGLETMLSGIEAKGALVVPGVNNPANIMGKSYVGKWDGSGMQVYNIAGTPGGTQWAVDAGVSATFVFAYGHGSWTGGSADRFISYGSFTASLFSSDDGNWHGINIGYSGGFPFGIGKERTTNYE